MNKSTLIKKSIALVDLTKSAFSPDLNAEEMQEAVDSIYDHKAPRLASMKAWPQEWLDDQDKMGWLEWYKNYSEGRRSDTDEKQIKRWNSFKARHGSQFLANPTPRRAYALRNWAIDPVEMLPEDQRESFQKLMEAYKAKEYKKWDKKKAKEKDMEKASGVSKGMIKQFIGKELPIFHSMSGNNARGLLKEPKALSATEAITRGLADNIELGGRFGRYSVNEYLDDAVKATVKGDKATLNLRDLIRRTKIGRKPEYSLMGAGSDLTKIRYGGDISDYAKTSLLTTLGDQVGAGKNWGTISFSKGEPWREYGDFGIFTTPSRVKGKLYASLAELQAHPNWVLGKGGLPKTIELPNAPGKIFYHPSRENAELVRDLYAKYGKHSVIPWTPSLQRWFKKTNFPEIPRTNYEPGNLGYIQMKEKFPSFEKDSETTLNKLIGWLGKKV